MTRVWTDGYGGLALDAANLNAMEADIAAAKAGTGAPLWQAATNYNAGQAVITPNGDLVTANASFTSGATFAADAANWSSANRAVNVRNFGAKGDGTTDDTVAFQNAINAIKSATGLGLAVPTGSVIVIPPGRYKITSTLTVPRGIVFEGSSTHGAGESYGDSLGSVLLASTASMTMVSVNGGAGTLQSGPQFRHIIFADTTANTATLVSMTNVNRWAFEQCSFKDAAVGIAAAPGTSGDCSWWAINNCTFYNCTTGLNTSGSGTILGGDVVNCGTGINMSAATAAPLRLMGMKFDVNGTNTGILCKGASSQFISCAFETSNTAKSIVFDGTGTSPSGLSNSAIACEFTSHSGTDTAITITANANNTQIIGCTYNGSGTNVSDAGVNTQVTLGGDLVVGNKSPGRIGNLGTTDFWIDTSNSAQANSGVTIRGKGSSGIYILPGGVTQFSATSSGVSLYGVPPVSRAAAIAAANTQSASYVQADVQSIATAVNAIIAALKNIGITS